MKTFGDFIREQRDAQDLSVREFAKQLGNISPAHVSDIENGRRYPSEDLLKTIAQFLGVPRKELDQYDLRPPVDELKKLVRQDPTYGVALRRIAETKTDPQALLKFIEQKSKKSGQ